MDRFKHFFNEAAAVSVEQAILKDLSSKHGTKVGYNTGGRNGRWHLRFPVGDDVAAYFSRYGYTVSDADISISGQYATYVIKSSLGQAYFVNQTRSNSSIKTKDLAPDRFAGLTGVELTSAEVIKITKAGIEILPYSAPIKNLLKTLLKESSTKGAKFSIAPATGGITPAELRTISNDFGEICCALWSMKNIGFRKIIFPSAINEPLVDFYGIMGRIKYPISVKSGGGSPTSIKNISLLIKEKIAEPSFLQAFTMGEQKLLNALIVLTEMKIMEGWVHSHVIYQTKSIKILSNVTKIPVNGMSVQALNVWLKGKDSNELKKLLAGFYKELGNDVGRDTWKKYDDNNLREPVGVLLGPMGHSIVKVLNSDEASKVLTKVAQQITLLQMNVDVKTKTLSFKREKFKNFSFKFKWQGGAPNPNRNRLGFSAIVK
jgi:hypothetical protein